MIGAIAQLVERVLCKHEVVGSTPTGSTKKASARSRKTSFQSSWLCRMYWQNDIVN